MAEININDIGCYILTLPEPLDNSFVTGFIGEVCDDVFSDNSVTLKNGRETFNIKFSEYSAVSFTLPLKKLRAYYNGDKTITLYFCRELPYKQLISILKKWNIEESFENFMCWFNYTLRIRHVPELDNVTNPPVFECLRRPLFRYQYVDTTLMYNIEREGIGLNITTAFPDINEKSILVEIPPDSDLPLEYKTRIHGGIFANEVGTGKTAAILAHSVLHNTISIETINSFENKNAYSVPFVSESCRVLSRATLIFTENHLIAQLEKEIADTFDTGKFNIRTVIIRGKKDWLRVTVSDVVFATFIITTYSFIHGDAYDKNRKHINVEAISGFDTCIPFDMFHFNRVIVDEFQNEIKSKSMFLYQKKYRGTVFDKITSRYRWIMSGTPFSTVQSVHECMHFLIDDKKLFNRVIFNNRKSFEDISATLKKCTLRTRKRDISAEVKFPRVNMNIITIPMSQNERTLYTAMLKNSKYQRELRKFCICSNIGKAVDGNHVFCSLEDVEKKIISDAKNEIEKSKTTIVNLSAKANDIELILDSLISSEAALYSNKVAAFKANIEEEYEKIRSLTSFVRYIENEFKNSAEESHECDICDEDFDDNEHRRAMTQCAHSMCQRCINNIIEKKMKCPQCNAEIAEKTIYYIADNDSFNSDNYRMGSKISRLVHFLIDKIGNTDGNVLLFCTWDNIIPIIVGELEKNKIKTLYLRGNTASKTKILRLFNDPSNEYRLMVLSTESSAEGTNLTRADVVIFIDAVTTVNPKEDSFEFRRNKMRQAIGRSHRIGQENDVSVYMFLMENSVETDDIKNEMFTFVNEI